MIFRTVNPYTNEPLAVYEALSETALQRMLSKADWAYSHWRRTSYAYRAELFTRLAALLRANAEQYAQLITAEMGKIIAEARAEIEKCAWACEYYAQNAERFLLDQSMPSDGRRAWVRFDPIGCVLGIMPWNFPFWQVFRYAVPTLMAGNVTLLKHAPNTFGCGVQIEQLFKDVGFPEGVFQHAVIDVVQVEAVMAHAGVQAVTLTGSGLAGKKVASLAGKYLKKSVLELGGSDPFIVLKDADLRKAAKVGVQSRLLNAGQSCIAAKRFIVERTVFDDFKALMADAIHQHKQGNPLDASTTIGPLARIDLADRLHQQTRSSIILGAKVEVAGGQHEANFAPYLLSEVKPGMPAFDEELFGPVASLFVAADEQEAIEIANRTNYGLGASLWTQDEEKAERLAPSIEAGCVFVNSLVKSDPRLPFGGTKESGYGRELAHFGPMEFVNVKTVYVG